MMTWFDISEGRLKSEKEIDTPIKTLYWDYYKYVLDHPVEWSIHTSLLYGENDTICELDYVTAFAKSVGADITISKECEHFFHTHEQLNIFRKWLKDNIL